MCPSRRRRRPPFASRKARRRKPRPAPSRRRAVRASRRGPVRPGRRAAPGRACSHLNNASLAVCGSVNTEKRLMSETSVGGTCTAPPRRVIRVGGRVHVVDPDISDPARLCSHLPRVVRQLRQRADRGLSVAEQDKALAGHRRVPRAPAHDIGVEGHGRLDVCRNQLVPDETAMRIDHVRVPVLAILRQPFALLAETTAVAGA